ncbi:MAG TPA: LytR C-terminal domain-containing protein [Gaiellaceae bacterium]|nr:LytR C-terminal domain-containing protein [Gaiellaceae bacterium]
MEHAHPVNGPFSWRGAALAVALVGVVVLAGFGGMALLHHLSARATSGRLTTGHARTGKAAADTRLVPRSRTFVLVLNGNGFNGAAGNLATRLAGLGYAHAIPTDAPNTAYAVSLVLFRPGWENEAKRLAKDAHIAAIAPLDGRVAREYAHVQLVAIVGG